MDGLFGSSTANLLAGDESDDVNLSLMQQMTARIDLLRNEVSELKKAADGEEARTEKAVKLARAAEYAKNKRAWDKEKAHMNWKVGVAKAELSCAVRSPVCQRLLAHLPGPSRRIALATENQCPAPAGLTNRFDRLGPGPCAARGTESLTLSPPRSLLRNRQWSSTLQRSSPVST